MSALLIRIFGFVVSGLIFRLLASIGFSVVTAGFIMGVINDYITRAINSMGGISADLSGLLNLARADDMLSAWINVLLFIATYKSLKFVFVRK